MVSVERSLRVMIEDCLAIESADHVHITRLRRNSSTLERYVFVETTSADGQAAMFFLRHQDGRRWIFPPNSERPAMRSV
jgi:hypothetical protein